MRRPARCHALGLPWAIQKFSWYSPGPARCRSAGEAAPEAGVCYGHRLANPHCPPGHNTVAAGQGRYAARLVRWHQVQTVLRGIPSPVTNANPPPWATSSFRRESYRRYGPRLLTVSMRNTPTPKIQYGIGGSLHSRTYRENLNHFSNAEFSDGEGQNVLGQSTAECPGTEHLPKPIVISASLDLRNGQDRAVCHKECNCRQC